MNPQQIASQLKNYGSILLIAGGGPSVDTLGSTLALSLGLAALGKNTQVVTKNAIRAEHSRLVGVDKVESQVGGQKSFVISIPNAVDFIEKVSCYAEGQKLNIVLQPYADVKNFTPNDIQYANADGNFEAIVLVDVGSMQDVQSVFTEGQDIINQLPTIAIGRKADQRIANKLVDPKVIATSTLVLQLLEELGAPISADTATNLMQGVYAATDDFHSPNVTPEIFESAAKLLGIIHKETGRMQSPVGAYGNRNMPQFPLPTPQGQPGIQRPPMPKPMPPMQGQQAKGQMSGMQQPPRPPVQPQASFGTEGPSMPNMSNRPIENRAPAAREWEIEEDFETERDLDAPVQNSNATAQLQAALAQATAEAAQQRQAMPQQQSQQSGQRQQQQGNRQNRPQPNQNQNMPRPQQQNPMSQPPQHAPVQQSQPQQQQMLQTNGGQQPQINQEQPKQQSPQEDDWLSPKIYKTEDLL